jgi:hypothetical protein
MTDLFAPPVGVRLVVTPDDLAWGRTQCAKLDARYGKRRFPTVDNDDSRWRGCVADRVVAAYLAAHARAPFKWHPDGGYGAPDFTIHRTPAELKTVVRNVPPCRGYRVYYPGEGYDRRPDDVRPEAVCFASYQRGRHPEDDLVWLLGGIDLTRFLHLATLVRRGDVINMRPNGAAFPASADVYAMDIRDNLTPALAWLRELELRPTRGIHAGRGRPVS